MAGKAKLGASQRIETAGASKRIEIAGVQGGRGYMVVAGDKQAGKAGE